ncbi:uncharacterized protein LOC134834257 [Culicoides brevitarsis]|uniref:uncharacterized protein LOC134834257 n=1 Tax=Culicoides brevitarsis TaxID=469753 RepID=UPI00307BDACC
MSSVQPKDLNLGTNLMDLNDDCLLHLLRFFGLLELIDLRGICPRLDFLILEITKKFTSVSLKTLGVDTMEKFLKLVQFLGPSVKSLALDNLRCGFNKTRVFEWIDKYLVNLESLSNQGLAFYDSEVIEKFTPIVKRLKSLSLGSFYAYVCRDAMAKCFRNTKLEELEVIMSKHITVNFFQYVMNLKSLTLSSCQNLTWENYKQILKKNWGLKQLTIKVNCSEYQMMTLNESHFLVHFIAKNMHEIEDLTLDFFCPNVYILGDLPKLKKLKLNEFKSDQCHADKSVMLRDINRLLDKLSQKNIVEELDISSYDLLVDMKCLRKMTNLKKLTLYGGEYLKEILTLIEPLDKLEELKIEFGSLDLNFLNKLVQILKASEERPKLQVQAYEFVDEKSLLEKLLEDNKDVIEVRFFYPGVDDYESDDFEEDEFTQFLNSL